MAFPPVPVPPIPPLPPIKSTLAAVKIEPLTLTASPPVPPALTMVQRAEPVVVHATRASTPSLAAAMALKYDACVSVGGAIGISDADR